MTGRSNQNQKLEVRGEGTRLNGESSFANEQGNHSDAPAGSERYHLKANAPAQGALRRQNKTNSKKAAKIAAALSDNY